MVQKEVKKKTKIYGTVAVLSAIILVTMVYAIGSPQILYPPSQAPSVSGMKTFASIDELKNFLNTNSQGGSTYRGGPLDTKFFGFINGNAGTWQLRLLDLELLHNWRQKTPIQWIVLIQPPIFR